MAILLYIRQFLGACRAATPTLIARLRFNREGASANVKNTLPDIL